MRRGDLRTSSRRGGECLSAEWFCLGSFTRMATAWFGVWGLGFGVWVSGFGFRVSGFRFRISCFGSRVSCFVLRVAGSRFRVLGVPPRGRQAQARGGDAEDMPEPASDPPLLSPPSIRRAKSRLFAAATKPARSSRCRANMAQTRQSRPNNLALAFRLKSLHPCQVWPRVSGVPPRQSGLVFKNDRLVVVL